MELIYVMTYLSYHNLCRLELIYVNDIFQLLQSRKGGSTVKCANFTLWVNGVYDNTFNMFFIYIYMSI